MPLCDEFVTYCQNFDFKIRDHFNKSVDENKSVRDHFNKSVDENKSVRDHFNKSVDENSLS